MNSIKINSTPKNISRQHILDDHLLQLPNLTFELNVGFPGDLFAYRKSLRGYGKKVFNALYNFRKHEIFSKKLVDIAREVGCAEITVWRWTERFEADGIIRKHQPGYKRANRYRFNPAMKKQTFSMFLNDMTPQQEYDYFNYNIIPYKNSRAVFSLQSDKHIKSIYLTIKALSNTARAHEAARFKKSIKGESMVTPVPVIPKSLENFKSLKLTLEGKIYLSIYPDDILAIADKRLKANIATVKKPIAYIQSVCNKLCEQRGITPNRSLRYQLAVAHKITLSDNSLLHEPVEIKPVDVIAQPSAKSSGRYEINESNFDPNLHTKNKAPDGSWVYAWRLYPVGGEKTVVRNRHMVETIEQCENELTRLHAIINNLKAFKNSYANQTIEDAIIKIKQLEEKLQNLQDAQHGSICS